MRKRRLVAGILASGSQTSTTPPEGAGCHPLVTAGVVDQRDVQPLGRRAVDRRQDLRHEVGRRDKVDVVAARPGAPASSRRGVRCSPGCRSHIGDRVVLAEAASAGAAREEDRAGSAVPLMGALPTGVHSTSRSPGRRPRRRPPRPPLSRSTPQARGTARSAPAAPWPRGLSRRGHRSDGARGNPGR